VYLYADGNGAGPSVAQYRNLRLSTLEPEIVDVRARESNDAPVSRVAWKQHGTSSYTARRASSEDATLVVLNEAYGAGWDIDGAHERAHVRVNGYANAWLVRGDARALELRYGPSRFSDLALIASVAAAVAAVVVVGVNRFRRRRAEDFLFDD
jgi:hypothetical protein